MISNSRSARRIVWASREGANSPDITVSVGECQYRMLLNEPKSVQMAISHDLAAPGTGLGSDVRETNSELRRGWPAIAACFCVAVFAWGFGFYGQAVFLSELHRMHGWSVSI